MRIRSLFPHSNCRRFRRGFTLSELAIVIGIIGLILAAIWVAAASVSSSNKNQTAQQETAYIIANYKPFSAQKASISAMVRISRALGSGRHQWRIRQFLFFPPNMIKGACTSGHNHDLSNQPLEWLCAGDSGC